MIVWKRALSVVSLGCGLLLTGCDFFVDPTNTGTTTGGGGGTPSITGDYVYVVNNGNSLSGYSVGASSLTSLFTPIGLPSPLSAASAVALTRDNTILFVGGLGGIVSYAVSSNGALTAVSGGATTELADFVSMVTSPDGKWLLALDAENNEIWVFSIEYTNQIANVQNEYTIDIGGNQITALTAPARSIAISPDGTAVAVAVGTAGDELFSFTTSSGYLSSVTAVPAPGAPYSDDSVGFDGSYSASAGTATASTHLYIGRGLIASGNSEILAYPLSGGTVGSPTTNPSGQNPYDLLVDATGTYLYSANRDNTTTAGTATISGYPVTASGTLTQLANSPFGSGSLVTAIAEDNAKTHLIAASAGGDSDITLYTFSTVTGDGGQLVQSATAANGTNTPGSIALATTH